MLMCQDGDGGNINLSKSDRYTYPYIEYSLLLPPFTSAFTFLRIAPVTMKCHRDKTNPPNDEYYRQDDTSSNMNRDGGQSAEGGQGRGMDRGGMLGVSNCIQVRARGICAVKYLMKTRFHPCMGNHKGRGVVGEAVKGAGTRDGDTKRHLAGKGRANHRLYTMGGPRRRAGNIWDTLLVLQLKS